MTLGSKTSCFFNMAIFIYDFLLSFKNKKAMQNDIKPLKCRFPVNKCNHVIDYISVG